MGRGKRKKELKRRVEGKCKKPDLDFGGSQCVFVGKSTCDQLTAKSGHSIHSYHHPSEVSANWCLGDMLSLNQRTSFTVNKLRQTCSFYLRPVRTLLSNLRSLGRYQL